MRPSGSGHCALVCSPGDTQHLRLLDPGAPLPLAAGGLGSCQHLLLYCLGTCPAACPSCLLVAADLGAEANTQRPRKSVYVGCTLCHQRQCMNFICPLLRCSSSRQRRKPSFGLKLNQCPSNELSKGLTSGDFAVPLGWARAEARWCPLLHGSLSGCSQGGADAQQSSPRNRQTASWGGALLQQSLGCPRSLGADVGS